MIYFLRITPSSIPRVSCTLDVSQRKKNTVFFCIFLWSPSADSHPILWMRISKTMRSTLGTECGRGDIQLLWEMWWTVVVGGGNGSLNTTLNLWGRRRGKSPKSLSRQIERLLWKIPIPKLMYQWVWFPSRSPAFMNHTEKTGQDIACEGLRSPGFTYSILKTIPELYSE